MSWYAATENLVRCDICGIGLGDYTFTYKRNNKADLGKEFTEIIHGEKEIIWDGGVVSLSYVQSMSSDFVDRWVCEQVIPKKVCPRCYKKYRRQNE